MSTKHEKKLWDVVNWLQVLLSILVIILLGVAYFAVAKWQAIDDIWRGFLLSIIGNLIPTFILFAGAYFLFRGLNDLRSEQNADEIAEKILTRLIESPKISLNPKIPENNVSDPAKPKTKFSDLHMKLLREFDVVVKSFDSSATPQKLEIECNYRGDSTFLIKKATFSGLTLNIKDDLIKYKLDNNGFHALIRNDKQIVSPEQPLYTVELVLTAKWNIETIEKRLGNLGYLFFEIEHGAEVVNLQKKI
jgi:hypothetical protein